MTFKLIFCQKTEAEKNYIQLVNELAKNEKPQETVAPSTGVGKTSAQKYQDILTSVEYGTVFKIVLNRPNKLNALTFKVHIDLDN